MTPTRRAPHTGRVLHGGAAFAVLGLTLVAGHAQQPTLAGATPSSGGQSTPSSPLSAPGGLLAAPPSIRSAHLDVVASTTAPTVRGKPIALTVDVTPKKDVHVYAPGNASYAAVTLTVNSQPGVRVGAVTYPKAEVFFFAPLNERVHVYSKAFQLKREIVVEVTPSATPSSAVQTLTITGRLDYQACDDNVCYLPQTLPLSWTVTRGRQGPVQHEP